jgi:hypothetical protein
LKGIEDPIARARVQKRLEEEMLMDDETPLWGMLRDEFLEELDRIYLDVVRPVQLYMGTVSAVWKETMAEYRAAGEKIVRKHFETAWKEEAEAQVGRGAGEVFVYLMQTVWGTDSHPHAPAYEERGGGCFPCVEGGPHGASRGE